MTKHNTKHNWFSLSDEDEEDQGLKLLEKQIDEINFDDDEETID